MFTKLQDIESKREKATALEKKLSKMADGPKNKSHRDKQKKRKKKKKRKKQKT